MPPDPDHGDAPGAEPRGAPDTTWTHRFVFFLVGIVAFQRRVGIVGPVEYGTLLAAATGGGLLTVGAPSALAGLLAVAVIGLCDPANRGEDAPTANLLVDVQALRGNLELMLGDRTAAPGA